MDHLPKLQDPCYGHISVPFLGCAPLEGQGFWSYPATQGFNVDDLMNGLGTNGVYLGLLKQSQRDGTFDYGEMASFFQSWWYFGMLNEVLGVTVDVKDFLKSDNPEPGDGRTTSDIVITTEKLEKYLQEWRKRLEKFPGEEIVQRLKNAMKCIAQVHRWIQDLSRRIEFHVREPIPEPYVSPDILKIGQYMRRATDSGKISVSDSAFALIRKHYGDGSETSFDANGRVRIPTGELLKVDGSTWTKFGRKILPEELELSICILGFSLSHAVKSISSKVGLGSLGVFPHEGWYCPKFIYNRMISEGSCRRSIERFNPTLLLVGGYLSSRLQYPGIVEPSHSECSKTECKSDKIEDFVYRRSHQDGCQGCIDVFTSDVTDSVADILRNGGIPVLRLSPRSASKRLTVEVLSSTAPEVPYVAFSHVWSDGLGNPKENKLYECQWQWLQKLADETLFKSPAWFWIDTICVPLATSQLSNDQNGQAENLRATAISKMRKTYVNADKVLIVDKHLTSMTSEMSVFEFSLRLTLSKWMRRLWTMHEGAVARPGAVCVKLKDGVTSLKRNLRDIAVTIEQDESKENESIISSLGMMEVVTAWSFCLEVDAKLFEESFVFAWNESRSRGTKYEADRYVVVGSLLQLESQKTYKMTEDEKMRFLFTNVRSIPPGVLFMGGPRFKNEGWRWAPSSLSKEGRSIDVIPNVPTATLQERGLNVTFRGWILDGHLEWDRRFQYDGKWTVVMARSKEPLGRCVWVVEIFQESRITELYSVDVAASDHAEPWISSSSPLGLILQGTFDNHRNFSRGALVSIRDTVGNGENSRIHARFEFDLNVSRLNLDESKTVRKMIASDQVQLIQARWITDQKPQKWCIA